MNDPHVESLVYELKTDETLRFANPDPVEGDAGGFVYRLADGVLAVTMKEHRRSTSSRAAGWSWGSGPAGLRPSTRRTAFLGPRCASA